MKVIEKRSIIRNNDQYYAVFVEDGTGFNCKGGLPELERFMGWCKNNNVEIVTSAPGCNGFFEKGLDTYLETYMVNISKKDDK